MSKVTSFFTFLVGDLFIFCFVFGGAILLKLNITQSWMIGTLIYMIGKNLMFIHAIDDDFNIPKQKESSPRTPLKEKDPEKPIDITE